MFIRQKKRMLGGKAVSYAYLVKNRWDKKKALPKQSVSKYLGRVIECSKRDDQDFLSYVKARDYEGYAADNSRKRIISDLASWEIACHGIDAKAGSSVIMDGKNVVLKINEGYLCSFTLSRLNNFRTEEEDPHLAGVELATRFSEAGIRIPKELFVAIYDKFAGVIY